MKIAVIGAGRWGGTLAKYFSDQGHEVTLICQDWELKGWQHRPIIPFSDGIALPPKVQISSNQEDLLDKPIVFLAVPGKYFQKTWNYYQDFVDGTVINASKVIDFEDGNLVLPDKVINRENYIHLGSAAFPNQLLDDQPTMGTLYSKSGQLEFIQTELSSKNLWLYRSTDLIGGQLASALKNVVALAVGIAAKHGFKDCTQATLINKGMAEVARFACHVGASPATFMVGVTALTDAIATATSPNSHNRRAGMLVNSLSKEQIEAQIGTVEGFHTLNVLSQIPEAFKLMPIAKATYLTVFKQVPALESFGELFARPLKEE